MGSLKGAAGLLLKTGGGGPKRYWRVYVTAVVGGVDYCAIAEVEWRLTSGGSALAVSATAASTTLSGSFTSSKAVDGIINDANNCWLPTYNTFPDWISFDLGSAQGPVEVAIWPQYDPVGTNRAPTNFLIQSSPDTLAWTTTNTYSGITGWAGGTGVAKTFTVTP